MRASPAFKIIDGLLRLGARVKIYDPQALPNAKQVYRNRVAYTDMARDCLAGAECCILVKHWPEFRELRPEIFPRQMKHPFLVDARRLYDAASFSA